MISGCRCTAHARTAIGLVFLFAALGSASADLRLTVTVNSSGATGGLPASGQYEIDYRPGLARVVRPDGRVEIFDFKTSQIVKLNPGSKTYQSVGFLNEVQPTNGAVRSAIFARDNSTSPRPMLGSSASRYLIGEPSSGGRRRGPGATPVGDSWVVDGSSMRSSVGSILPLVLIAAPKPLALSVAQQLNSAGDFPVELSFHWNRGAAGFASVGTTVTSIDRSPQEASKFAVPAGYTSVGLAH